MSHLPDLMQQITENTWYASPDTTRNIASSSAKNAGNKVALWREATEALIMPMHSLIAAINDGLEHAGLQLGLIRRRAQSGHKDAESHGGTTQPGDSTFSAYLEEKLNDFSRGRLQSLSAWTIDNDISQGQEPGFLPKGGGFDGHDVGDTETPTNYRQLNLILYIHQMVSWTLLMSCSYADIMHRSSIRPAWLCLSSANSQTAWCYKA